MNATENVTVNGREYAVNMYSPVRMFDLYYEFVASCERNESLGKYYKAAIGQCFDVMMRPLDKLENFEGCFAQYPEDMFPLGRAALNVLIGPFLQKRSDTTTIANV